jgi:CheY-like chemotaxis protein
VIEKSDGTIYGNGVNIAARLESISKPQGICIDGATHSIINGKLSVGYAYLGEQALKNVEHPVEAYRVLTDSHCIGKTTVEANPSKDADRQVICFIDDDPHELDIFARVFGNDFRILGGNRFVEAKEKLTEAGRRPNLFLLDLYFPTGRDSTPEERLEMARLKGEVEAAQARLNAYLAQIGQDRSGGLRLLSQVRREFPDTPIVFYTRKGTLEDVNACLEAGAAAVLKKPQPSSLDPALDIHSQLESAALGSKNSVLSKLEAILASKPAGGLFSRIFKR